MRLLTRFASVLLCLMYAGLWNINSPAATQKSNKKEFSSVRLTLVSQRWMPKDPPVEKSEPRDVHLIGEGDDLLVCFRLANEGKENIYYLASIHEPGPTGYILFRQAGEWKAITPDRGREGSLTGDGYNWVLLAPGTAVEFEFSDLSTRKGEHAASVLVNDKADHTGRVEVISDPYQPMSRNPKENRERRQ
jgi:hypothetical protein